MLETFQGFFTEFSNLSKYSDSIKNHENTTEKEINELLNRVNKKNDIKEILALVKYRRTQVDITPAYKNEVVSISKQILSFGAAGLALVAAFAKDIANLPENFAKLISFLGLFYFDLILLSLLIIFIFLWQSRFRYPFLYLNKLGNAKPYFYYSSISHDTPYEFFQSKKTKHKAIKLYLSDLTGFTDYLIHSVVEDIDKANAKETLYQRIRGWYRSYFLDKPKPEENQNVKALKRQLKDELLQYFLLISYQGYVNQYEVRINNIFIYGLVGSFLSVIVVSINFIPLANVLVVVFILMALIIVMRILSKKEKTIPGILSWNNLTFAFLFFLGVNLLAYSGLNNSFNKIIGERNQQTFPIDSLIHKEIKLMQDTIATSSTITKAKLDSMDHEIDSLNKVILSIDQKADSLP